jgi:hypothetical protein
MIKRYAKALVALAGTALEVVNVAALPERWQSWIAAALAVATTLGVRGVPNQTSAAPPAATNDDY